MRGVRANVSLSTPLAARIGNEPHCPGSVDGCSDSSSSPSSSSSEASPSSKTSPRTDIALSSVLARAALRSRREEEDVEEGAVVVVVVVAAPAAGGDGDGDGAPSSLIPASAPDKE